MRRVSESTSSPRASLEPVAEVIEQDLRLSVKLLRYLDSAYFGLVPGSALSTMPPSVSGPGMSRGGR